MILLAFLASLASAETLYANAPTSGQRWPDSPKGISLTVAAGDELEVLARDGDKVRVRKGPDFGWVDAKFLGAQPAIPSLPLDIDTEALPEAPGE